MGKRAIVVVDLQNEYLSSGKLPLVGIEDAVSNAARVIDAARSRGDTLIHVRHESPTADAPFFAAGSENVKTIAAVQPEGDEPVIVKQYPNAFRETGLKAMLDEKGVEEVVVIGAMSHMCIDATSRAAADFGYAVTVVHDACATRDVEFGGKTVQASDVHAAYMSALGWAYGQVVSSDELLAR
ncbi:MAG: Isochorismatase [Microvirga sp.]|jgi:nicotinamidase-related amidase|nr:Isochorismatase [Microvirga sp.]